MVHSEPRLWARLGRYAGVLGISALTALAISSCSGAERTVPGAASAASSASYVALRPAAQFDEAEEVAVAARPTCSGESDPRCATWAPGHDVGKLTYVSFPVNNSIQTDLISTFPIGIFKAHDALKTPFKIKSSPRTCGYASTGPCNFNDAFGQNGSGQAITLKVSIANVAHAYTLMNAYYPADSQLATVEFFGSKGAHVSFPLIGGKDIRDFYQGEYVNSLTNGIPHVKATNAFTCNDPQTCLGGAGTGNVNNGLQGTYVIDEQAYDLPAAFKKQTLIEIVITDTANGSTPIVLGITVGP